MRDILTSYTFVASAKTIQLAFDPVVPEKLLGIWNASRGAKLYDPHTPGFGATIAGDTVTLVDIDTTTHDDADVLLIFYEGVVSNTLATQQGLADILTALGFLGTATNQINLNNAVGNPGDVVAPSDTGTHNLISLIKRISQHLSSQLTAGDVSALATASNQTTGNTVLADILAELRDDVLVNHSLWEDSDTGIFYREEQVRSQDTGTIVTRIIRLSDNAVLGSLPLDATPVETSDVRVVEASRFKAVNAGTGYSTGDWITQVTIIDTTGSGSVVNTFWHNLTTGNPIAPPDADDIILSTDQLIGETNTILNLLLLATTAIEVIKTPKSATANIPAIGTTATTILASNANRKSWGIQNLGTNTLYVRMGASASTSLFHFALAPGTTSDDGMGASISDDTYSGEVSVAGTSPRYIHYEL